LPRLREFDIMSSTDGEWRGRLSPNNNTRHRFWTPGGYGRRGIKLISSGAVLTRTTWRVIYLTVIFLSLALTLAAYLIVEALIIQRLDLEARGNVQNEINLLGVKLQHSVDKINTVSAAIVSAIERDKDISEADFADLVGDLLDVVPEMRHAAAAPGLVIRYVHPMEGNAAAIGLDYRDVPAQLLPIRRVIQTNETVLAGPVDLVQGGQAFIGRTAAYIPDPKTGGRYFWGIVSVVFETERIYRMIGFDQLSAIEATVGNLSAEEGAAGRSLLGSETVLEQNPVTVDVPVLDGIWRIAAVPRGGWSNYADELANLRIRFAVGAAVLMMTVIAVVRAFRQRSEARGQLYTAINSIEDAFAYYDSDYRLILSNAKYREYYKESSPAFQYGATFESILRYGLERGQYVDAVGREEEWLKERLESHRQSNTKTEQRLKDGRWIRVLETRTPDGGIVGFRVDITELKNARDEAERANRAKSVGEDQSSANAVRAISRAKALPRLSTLARRSMAATIQPAIVSGSLG
jgi:two-component system cell cycle sensor histidine kinase PleC